MMQHDKQPSPGAAVLDAIAGYWSARALYVAAKLGLADLVQDGARTADELATLTGTHAPSLYRLMRALCSIGWFEEDAAGRFGPTSLTAALRTGAPGSLRHFAITELGEEHYAAWGELLSSVTTGGLGFDAVFGRPLWEFCARHPATAGVFERAMSDVTAALEPVILKACDFSGAARIVDVGGGAGTLMAAILAAHPDARGVVFDLPHVIGHVKRGVGLRGLADRCELAAGDFFDGVPDGGDAYILKWILHDWDDERSVAILRQCHRAMAARGTLHLIEAIIPAGNAPFFHKLMDLNMLVMTGGRERTEAEYRALLERAGFRLVRCTVTPSEMAILQAVRE